MSFLEESFYFEKRGDRYIYRPTVFSTGYDISETEKNQLYKGLVRLQWRSLLEAGIAVALIALAFMAGVVKTQTPIPLFLICSILAVIILGVTVLRRRDRLVVRVLGQRSPDVPRLPFRQALARPRPGLGRQFAIPILKSVVVLFTLALATSDGVCAYLIIRAYRARESAGGPDESAAVERIFALWVNNWQFWTAVAAFNAVLLTCIILLIYQVRFLHKTLDSE